jgi:ribosomal protein L37AE/L43A
MSANKEEFNKIPIHFCENCLSIKILRISPNINLCLDCNSTDIGSTDFRCWEIAYELEYNVKFIDKKNGKY